MQSCCECQSGHPAFWNATFLSTRPADYGYDVYRGDRVRFITDSATLPKDIAGYDRSRQEA